MTSSPLKSNSESSKSLPALVVQRYHKTTDKQGVAEEISTNISLPTTALVFRSQKGNVVTDSRRVAKGFNKTHAHVLRDIEALECSAEFRQSNFGLTFYLDKQKKKRPNVVMTKAGFTFLIMGFTGKRAGEFKESYLRQFEQMEAELQALHKPVPVVNLLDNSRRDVQLASSQSINNYQYLLGGIGSVIEYNRKNCLLHTGLRPSEIIKQAKADKLPAKNRSSAKEVLRLTAPPTACAMALADQLVQGGLTLEHAAGISTNSMPIFAAIIAAGFQTSQLARPSK